MAGWNRPMSFCTTQTAAARQRESVEMAPI